MHTEKILSEKTPPLTQRGLSGNLKMNWRGDSHIPTPLQRLSEAQDMMEWRGNSYVVIHSGRDEVGPAGRSDNRLVEVNVPRETMAKQNQKVEVKRRDKK